LSWCVFYIYSVKRVVLFLELYCRVLFEGIFTTGNVKLATEESMKLVKSLTKRFANIVSHYIDTLTCSVANCQLSVLKVII